jgi:hypothetical protein
MGVGMSRVVDYLQTQPFADKSKLIAIGHSRIGKATLIAGAFDDRFALVAPAGSGAFGTGAFRFNGATNGGKEGLNEIIKRFPYWVGPEMPQFQGRFTNCLLMNTGSSRWWLRDDLFRWKALTINTVMAMRSKNPIWLRCRYMNFWACLTG